MAIIPRGGRGRGAPPPDEGSGPPSDPAPVPVAGTVGPSLAALRRTRPPRTAAFPVHADLVDALARDRPQPDGVAAHVLAALAGYAYADLDTVAAMATRLGLESARVARVGRPVDAMGITSTCDIVQSADGRVVLVAYRGDGRAPALSALTGAEGQSEDVRLDMTDPQSGPGGPAVHGAVYRNTWATRGAVLTALAQARAGRSVLDAGRGVQRPAEAVYLTGHGLGGAVAVLLAVLVASEPEFADIAGALRGVYTFGQPMAGNAAFARAASGLLLPGRTPSGKGPALGERVFRYVYRRDVVAQLPPWAAGDYAHFGREYRFGDAGWKATRAREAFLPMGEVAVAAGDFLARQHPLLRRLPFRWSLADHAPQHYVSALTPPGRPAEFGDHYPVTRAD